MILASLSTGSDSMDGGLEPHALAIGRIALAWNELHEVLGQIFAQLFTKSHGDTSMSIWNALDSDRTQRKLLRAAATVVLSHNKGLSKS